MSEEEKGDGRDSDLVVVGSSAGGIEAISILVSTLAKDFPAPLVLAQHLDPTRASSLDVILRRRSTLPVELVTSRKLLEPGKVYVVPSNRLVSIQDGHVEVQEGNFSRTRARPSVDMLFSSAAEAYGERLIAVILTGSGSDGAAGAVEVKNAGGTVIVQDPRTARYPSMPLALPPSVIDCEAVLEQIGPLLYDLLTGMPLPHTEDRTEDILRHILERVSQQAAFDFKSYKTSTILRRISRRMAVVHSRTMRDYLEYLKVHPGEVGELVKAFLINVTQFFRDSAAFDYLKSDILPQIIAHARERNHVLRFWTAGCATGEEPYSLAMLLTALLGAELPEWSVKIFATDLSEAAIDFARRGLYSDIVLKGISPEYQDRFFERADHGYRVTKALRQMVIFGQQDLTRNAPFPRVDLLLCRNVLIYFTSELQDYVLNQFAFSLSTGGYLFLGKAETVRPTQAYFELVNKHWKLYRYAGDDLPAGRMQRFVEQRPPLPNKPAMQLRSAASEEQYPAQTAPSPTFEIGELRRLNELLLRFLPTGVVVINRSYQVLTANGTARRLLGLRDIGNKQDFLHTVRGIPYTEVRNAIDTVFRERGSITLPEVLFDPAVDGTKRSVSLSISLMQLDAGTPDLAMMSVIDVTEQLQLRHQLEAIQSEQTRLMLELSTANRRLNEINKELVDSNEELQVTNEELVLTHEELQASIEEFETTNEELQATNEELETSNEELQATNEELETTNDELRARGNDMQELTILLESQRKRLAEMVELAPFSILVLRGPRLIVEAYNPHYTPQIEASTVLDRPLEDVFAYFWHNENGVPLVRLAQEVYRQNVTRTTTGIPTGVLNEHKPGEQHFAWTLIPSHDVTGQVSGVVIYATNETERLTREAEEERERLRLIIENTSATALALYESQTGALITGSPRYLEIVAHVQQEGTQGAINRAPAGRWHDVSFVASSEEMDRLMESHMSLRRSGVHIKLAGDGPETIWDWTFTPIVQKENPDGVQYILVTAVEITEAARARQEMEQFNHLRDDFLSFASHELRTPLTAIQGNAQLLQRQLRRKMKASGDGADHLDGRVQDIQILERIISAAIQLNHLIEELLDMTRIRSGILELQDHENVNIVAVIRRVVEDCATTANRVITVETSAGAIGGRWDETRIEQVVQNLLRNAIKYSPADTTIAVGLERQPDEVVVQVRDHGKGIRAEDTAHIFERFYRVHGNEQTRVDGLGLGLYIAHEIVTRYGGRMWVESTPGEGSTFYVMLPIVKTDT